MASGSNNSTEDVIVINCRCNKKDMDNGKMLIECSTCKEWKHAKCYDLTVTVNQQEIFINTELLKESHEWFCSPQCNQPKRFVYSPLYFKGEIKIRLLSTFGKENDYLYRYVVAEDLQQIEGCLFTSLSPEDYFEITCQGDTKKVITKKGLGLLICNHFIQNTIFRTFLTHCVLPYLK